MSSAFKNTDTLWVFVRGLIKKGRRLQREFTRSGSILIRHDLFVLKKTYYVVSMEVHETNKGRKKGGELNLTRFSNEIAADRHLKKITKTLNII